MTDDMPDFICAWPFRDWNQKDNPDGTKSRVGFIGGQWSKNKAHMPGVVKYVRGDLYDTGRQRAERAEAKARRLRAAALEVAAFRAQVTHGGLCRMSLTQAMGRLETALRQDEGDRE